MKDVTDLHAEFDGERLPPGQRETTRFPVLSKGGTPSVPADPTLEVWGAVEAELTLSLDDLEELGAETQRQDFHCVTGWSRFDCEFRGLPFPRLTEHAGVDGDAAHVVFHAHDGYTTNLPLEECRRREVLFAWELDGEPLPADHELWRMRNVLITPHNSGYTSRYYPRLADILAGNLRRVDETGSYEGLDNQVV